MPNFRKVVLTDPSHDMPLPAPHNRLFDKAGEVVDVADPFWIARLADESVVYADIAAAAAPLALPAPSEAPLAALATLAAGLTA